MTRLSDQPREFFPFTSIPAPREPEHGESDAAADHGLPQLVCAWCRPMHVIREGSLPASHGICPTAQARLDAEVEQRARVLSLTIAAINQACGLTPDGPLGKRQSELDPLMRDRG